MRNAIVILLPLMVLTVSCSSRQERRLTVGMSLPQSLNALTASGAHETLLDVVPPAEGHELRCFELQDRRLVCVVVSGQFVVGLSVCDGSSEAEGQREWTSVEALRL